MSRKEEKDSGVAAFETKFHHVRQALKELHVEVEMFRVLAGDRNLWDKAATLAEVEHLIKQALASLRESDERDAAGLADGHDPAPENPRLDGDGPR